MTLSTAIGFLHLLATVTWIGGMVFANLVLMPSLAAIDPPQRGRLMGAVVKRFSMLSWGSIAVLLVTGLIATPSQQLLNLSTIWGVTLAIKHLLVLSMLVIGVLVGFVVSPKLQAKAPPPGQPPTSDYLKAQKQLSVLATVNMILGILVLLLAAAL
jgi:uncharacterized membrane protein